MAPNANFVNIPIETYERNETENNFGEGVLSIPRTFLSYEQYRSSQSSHVEVQPRREPFQIDYTPLNNITMFNTAYRRLGVQIDLVGDDMHLLIQESLPNSNSDTHLEAFSLIAANHQFTDYIAMHVDFFSGFIQIIQDPSLHEIMSMTPNRYNHHSQQIQTAIFQITQMLSKTNPTSRKFYLKPTHPKTKVSFKT